MKERTEIDRPAAHVWRFVVTPELFLQWNDKVVDMEAGYLGDVVTYVAKLLTSPSRVGNVDSCHDAPD
ncbi:MAG: hypothetical protein AABZ15_02835 [Nitrospirota bacterium]